MDNRVPINARVPVDVDIAFRLAMAQRRVRKMQDALVSAMNDWASGRTAPYISDSKLVDNSTPEGITSKCAIPYQSEIGWLIEIMESGNTEYATAIHASLKALARGVKVERSIDTAGEQGSSRRDRLLGEAEGMPDTPSGVAARREGVASAVATREAEEKIARKRDKTA